MTLPSTPPLSGSQIAAELGLSFPLSMNHPFVLALANKTGFPYSFSDLLGKTGRFDGNGTISQIGQFQYQAALPNPPFFGGTLALIQETTSTVGIIANSPYPNWTGNVFVKDNTTGQSKVLTYGGSGTWTASGSIGIFGSSGTHNFTILPSS